MGALTSRQHAGVEEVDIPSNSVYRYPPKSGEGRARAGGPGGGEGERRGGGPGGPRVGLGAGQVAGVEGVQGWEVSSIPDPGDAARGLQVPAGSPRSPSSEDGLGGLLCSAPGTRAACPGCGVAATAGLERHP